MQQEQDSQRSTSIPLQFHSPFFKRTWSLKLTTVPTYRLSTCCISQKRTSPAVLLQPSIESRLADAEDRRCLPDGSLETVLSAAIFVRRSTIFRWIPERSPHPSVPRPLAPSLRSAVATLFVSQDSPEKSRRFQPATKSSSTSQYILPPFFK
jgi:hypothetical protein